MCLVTACAIRGRDVSVLHGHSVKAPGIARVTVGGQTVLPDNFLILVAFGARCGDIRGVDARLGVLHQRERVLTVAIRAGRALHLAFPQRLPVNADLVLVVNLHVAPAAHLPYIDPVGA